MGQQLMNWKQLMSPNRVGFSGPVIASDDESARNQYERDWDRILFSSAFRRMHNKTQVFPLLDADIVHSRLTHSLEASSIGRSLGSAIGKIVGGGDTGIEPHYFGTVVAAACLAHDIGNPPFGHSGEKSIGKFFNDKKEHLDALPDNVKDEFFEFEGNAQGFRIITRLQLEANNGLQLTAATLGAFTKYPCSRAARNSASSSTKKHGFFNADIEVFSRVATEVGLLQTAAESWCRHPLAFVVEAADDICYAILDVEDGVRKKLISEGDAIKTLCIGHDDWGSGVGKFETPADKIGYLRAKLINQLILECVNAFRACEDQLLSGKFLRTLVEEIPSASKLDALKNLARSHCYNAIEVLQIELAGQEVLTELLGLFVPVAAETTEKRKNPSKAKLLLAQLGVRLRDEQSYYERLLRITDFISGMTDRHALSTYRSLKGVSLAGKTY